MTEYRIEWFVYDSKQQGNGDWHNSTDKELLRDTIIYMNEKYSGKMNHWLITR